MDFYWKNSCSSNNRSLRLAFSIIASDKYGPFLILETIFSKKKFIFNISYFFSQDKRLHLNMYQSSMGKAIFFISFAYDINRRGLLNSRIMSHSQYQKVTNMGKNAIFYIFGAHILKDSVIQFHFLQILNWYINLN